MKKLITVIALSIAFLVPTLVTTNKIILFTVSNSLNTDNTYTNVVQDENGEQYIVKSFDDIQGQWLNATITDRNEIVGYTFLK